MDPFDLRRWQGFVAAGGDSSAPATICAVAVHSSAVCEPHTLFVALEGSHTDGHHHLAAAHASGAQFALVNRDVSAPEGLHLLRVPDPLTALQEIATAYRSQVRTPTLAITGSYGKTLTKDLLKGLLSSQMRVCASPGSLNSQLGVALSLLSISRNDDIALIEAGVSLPGEMARLAHMIQPNYALLTTIEGAHLDTMGSRERIAEEKSLLLRAVPKEGWVLVPKHPQFDGIAAEQICWEEEQAHLPHVQKRHHHFHIQLPTGEELDRPLKRSAPRQTELLRRALKAAYLLGVRGQPLLDATLRYTPENLFTEVWTSPLGTTILNDCYCSDPMSVERAFRLLDKQAPERKRIFVFEGFGSGSVTPGMRRHLAGAVQSHQVDQVVLVDHAQTLAADLQESGAALTLCANPREAWNLVRSEQHTKPAVLIKGPKRKPLDQLGEEFADGLGDNRLCLQFDRVQTNLSTFRNHLGPQTKICAMVKAHGYGTDAIAMAKFLSQQGVDIFGVAHMHEAIALRLAGITNDIFCLYAAPYEVAQAVEWEIQVAADNLPFLELLSAEATGQGKRAQVHLHVDTGMSRLGCRPEEATPLARAIESAKGLELAGLMTHFACADDPEKDPFTRAQLDRFAALKIDAPLIHAGNSAAAIRFDLGETNMVRLGLGLLGLHASPACTLPLIPAVELTSRIADIHLCHAGETVSYGGTYTVKRPQERIGVIPLGYADGIPRTYGNRGHLHICGQLAPIVGTVCMDFLMCDLTHIPEAHEQDPVTFFGDQRPAEEFAREGQLTPYQLLTCLGPRVQRIFRYEPN